MAYEDLLNRGLIKLFPFDEMRNKRHRVIYDVLGLVSLEEARQAFNFAVRFVKEAEELLER